MILGCSTQGAYFILRAVVAGAGGEGEGVLIGDWAPIRDGTLISFFDISTQVCLTKHPNGRKEGSSFAPSYGNNGRVPLKTSSFFVM